MNLAGVDLNLLVSLRALLEEGHVTRAAGRVGISQPAMSKALTRLRGVLGDPLLVRGKGRMVLTPKAEELRVPLERILGDAESLLSGAAVFEPATATGTFRFLCDDYTSALLIPALTCRLQREAPNLTIRVGSRGGDPVALLERAEADLLLGPEVEYTGLYRKRLFRETWSCIAREGHPAIRKRLTLGQYLAAQHVVVSLRSEQRGLVNDALDAKRLSRRVAMTVPHFALVPRIVAETDFVATLHTRLARELEASRAIQVLKPPFPIPRFAVSQAWHERRHHDALHRWVRGVVAEVGAGIDR